MPAIDFDDILRAWQVNNKVNHELLDVCSDEDFDLKPGKGKTIRSAFVHLVGVRRSWAEVKLPKDAAGIAKLDWKAASRKEIEDGLESSSAVMESLFARLHEKPGGGRWSLPVFFAYCIAHEAHHRAQIEVALRVNGREPDDKFLYSLWDWDKKA